MEIHNAEGHSANKIWVIVLKWQINVLQCYWLYLKFLNTAYSTEKRAKKQ